jgi:hypothetical protein
VARTAHAIRASFLVAKQIGLFTSREDFLAIGANCFVVASKADPLAVLLHPIIAHKWAVALATHALRTIDFSLMQHEGIVGSNVLFAVATVGTGFVPLSVQIHFVLIIFNCFATPGALELGESEEVQLWPLEAKTTRSSSQPIHSDNHTLQVAAFVEIK